MKQECSDEHPMDDASATSVCYGIELALNSHVIGILIVATTYSGSVLWSMK